MDREARRREYAEGLRAEAARRFGAERAGALGQAIEDMARLDGGGCRVPRRSRGVPGLLHGARRVSPCELGAADAARAVRRKELSPVELLEAVLERIDAVDARVQAWARIDRARSARHRAAARRRRGAG